MASPVIDLQAVDKVYQIWSHPRARLTGAFAGRVAEAPLLPGFLRRAALAHRGDVCRQFYALRGVGFTVNRGETVGIIGRNGSGKSTTLKIIAGTVQPSAGTVRVVGRVAAMLELTSGFEPDFTGEENVFLSAAILGLSEEQTRARYQSILEFADIGEFIHQPVKTYSSGMLVRLAFAVHTAVDPEILIIDEALAVGDEVFRRKCFARLDRLREAGTTILFVSHDLGSIVNLCQRALFFHEGEIVMEGTPKQVTVEYQRFCHVSREESQRIIGRLREARARGVAAQVGAGEADWVEPGRSGEPDLTSGPDAAVAITQTSSGQFDPFLVSRSRVEYSCHGARIRDIRLVDSDGRPANLLQARARYTLEYKVEIHAAARNVTFAMLIKTMKGMELGGSRVLPWDQYVPEVKAGQVYTVRFHFMALLVPGLYFVNAGAEGEVEDKRAYLHRIVDALPFRVVREETLWPTGTVDFLIEPHYQLEDLADHGG